MKGWPVSTTHSIVGALVGFAAVGISVDAVNWGKLGGIVSSWVVSPLLAGTISFMLFMSVKKLILDSTNPRLMAKRFVPVYIFFVGLMIGMVTLLKGVKNTGYKPDFGFEGKILNALPIGIVAGLIAAALGVFIISRIKFEADSESHLVGIEKQFAVLMIFTAAAMAFAHGSNDVANAVGPLAAIASTIENGGQIAAKSSLPGWILLLGGIGIVVGLATYGYRVMATIGRKITELTPSRGFAAELGAASTVVLSFRLGAAHLNDSHLSGRRIRGWFSARCERLEL